MFEVLKVVVSITVGTGAYVGAKNAITYFLKK